MSEIGENAPPHPEAEPAAEPEPAPAPEPEPAAEPEPEPDIAPDAAIEPAPSDAAPAASAEGAPSEEAPAPPAEPPAPPRPHVPFAQRVEEQAQSMDSALTRLATAARTWAIWPPILAICAGAAAWGFRHPVELHKLETNKLAESDRIFMGIWVGTAFLALWSTCLVVALVRARLRRAPMRFTEAVSDVSQRLIPLAALPFVVGMMQGNPEKDGQKLTLFYVAVVALIVGRGVYAWGKSSPVTPFDEPDDRDLALARPSRAPAIAAGVAVALLGVAYGVYFTRLSIINHHALNTRTTDLGYYDNIFYQSAHGHPLGCSFIKAGYHGSAHFDPILVLLSPIYRLYPRAEFLLGLQSVWLAGGVVPLYLLAKHKLGRRLPGVILCALYLLYPALQGANLYEFHSLTLATPVILWLLYLLETKNFAGYWPVLALALLTREDMSLLLCFVGLYALLSDRARLARAGWITIGASLVYFVVVKRLFMTSADIFMSGKDAYSFAYYYDDLIPNHTGLGGMLLSLVTNPVFVLKTVFAEAKVVYLVLLFLPLAFLPFLVKPGRVMLVYGLVFTLLASRTAVFSVHFQYSSVLIPIAFALAPMALRRLEDGKAKTFGLDGARLSRAMLGAAVVASLLISWRFGGIVDNQSFKGGFSRVARKLTDPQEKVYAWIDDTAQRIPPEASVGVTNKLGPHASNHMEAYFYPEHTDVDYVFIDESELKAHDSERHATAMRSGQLIQLARNGKMALFKRNTDKPPPPASTASVPRAPADTDPQKEREKEHEGD